jgi:pyrroline-5-carboxylate reductase
MVVFKTKQFKVDWSGNETPAGAAGQVRLKQAFTPRMLTTRPAQSEHLDGKSTTLHYLVYSNKVCENSLCFTFEMGVSMLIKFCLFHY